MDRNSLVMMKNLTLAQFSLLALMALPTQAKAQSSSQSEEAFIHSLYAEALGVQQGYQWLDDLSTNVGPRLSGSPGDSMAVLWAVETLDSLGFDRVFTQAVDVRHWQRGEETADYQSASRSKVLHVTALGGSVPTPGGNGGEGITAEVIEIVGRDDLHAKGHLLKGKIAFFNEPMDPGLIRTGSAYGRAGWQRWGGASMAAKYGAVAVVVRSLTHRQDDFPHTGAMAYEEKVAKIPAAGISTNDANWLSSELKTAKNGHFHLVLGCKEKKRKPSYNVIAEWTGSSHSDEVVVVGGHLDSWDLGRGTQDDGAGVVHAMHALWLLKQSGYTPHRTHRIVLFANEEFGLDGARAYANEGLEAGKKHVIALESDGGSGAPRGFSVHDMPGAIEAIKPFNKQLARYGCRDWAIGGSGADVGQINDDGVLLIGYRGDSQRYFDYHHTAQDNMDSVHPRELEMGSASIAALLYLLDKNLVSR